MEGGRRRQTQNTWRMEPTRSQSICWRFINGSCRFGPRCNYRHERPVISSPPICKHFQRGGCWYGERCRFRHVLLSEIDDAVAGRRSSIPAVSSSSVSYAPDDRRGSEPALLQVEEMSRQECNRSEFVVNVSSRQHSTWGLAANSAEEQPPGIHSRATASWESDENSVVAQETSYNGTAGDGAAAAASCSQGNVEKMDAFLQNENMTCGICMDKVYENVDPRRRVFGILPNCNHAFCLHCIKTWRSTKNLGPDVVKTCPQCRVRSAFYVPTKNWVEGQEKEKIIAAFREKFRRKSCTYYSRYGCCPFKTECIYRHGRRARGRSFPYLSEEDDEDEGVDLLNLFIAMTLFGVDDEDDDCDFLFLHA